MDNKKRIVNLEYFMEMLHICPRLPGQTFDELLFEEEILAFFRFLGHNGEIKKLTNVNINKFHQPLRSFASIINKFLSEKSTGYDSLRLSQGQILWGLYHKKNNTQQFGVMFPIELTNEEIRNSEAYKEYYAVASGAPPPKTKVSVRKTKSSSDTSTTPLTAAGTRLLTSAKGKKPAKASKAKSLTVLSEDDDNQDDDDQDEGDDDDDQDEGNDDDQDTNEEGEEFIHPNEKGQDAEDDEDELYRDVDINLEGRVVQMADVHTTQEFEDTHVTLTPVNPDGQQHSSSVSSQFVTSMLNPTPDARIDSLFETTSQMDVQAPTRVASLTLSAPTLTPSTIPTISTVPQVPTPPTTAPSNLLQDLPNFGSLFGFDHRLKTLEANFSEFMNEIVKVAIQIQSDRLRDEAQAENEEFPKNLDENIQKIIKEQVKDQVSKILPKIEKTVNEQLEAEVLTRSSNSSKTSYAVTVDLSEMELKKIIIEKMEGNKSLHRSDEQQNLYKALAEAYESDKIILDTYRDIVTLKRCRDDDADKDEEPSAGSDWGSKRRREEKEPESTSAPKEKATRTTGKSIQGLKYQQKTASDSAPAEELMQTTQDLEEPSHQEFAIDTLTPKFLAGPTYELMKGSCKSIVELEFFLEEVYNATTYQLDWNNPEGQQYPHNLLKPLPLIPNSQGHRVIPFDHFINNDLEYLRGVAQLQASGLDHGARNDDKLYKFKEGDFKRLRIQDIKDMLLLLVQGKLINLTIEEHFAFNVSLRMFTRSIVMQRHVEDLQLGIKSYQKKLNLTKLDTYRFDLKRKEAYTAFSNPRGFIYQNKDKQNRFQNQAPEGEATSIPKSQILESQILKSQTIFHETHIEPTLLSPTTYKRQRKTHKRRRTQKAVVLPQTIVPQNLKADEVVNKEEGDKVERVITNDASLEAAQDRDNIIKTLTTAMPNVDISQGIDTGGSPRRQETMEGTSAQTRYERVLEQTNEPPLIKGHTSRSGVGSLEENIELTYTVPTPYDLPRTEGYTHGSDEGRITLNELMETCTTLSNRVTQFKNELLTTKAVYNKAFITLTNRVKKLKSQLKQKRSSAIIHSSDKEGPREVQETAEHSRDDDDETLAKTLLNIMRSTKDKGKGIMQDTELPKKLKKKEMLQLKEIEEEAETQGDSDQEVEELKLYMIIIPEKDIAIEAIPLAIKPLVIIEYKIVKEGKINTYYITRADGSTRRYTAMINLLENINREDLETLWRLVKDKYGNTRPEEGYERVLWGDLKVMFEPDIESEVWRKIQGYEVTIWKLFSSCGVQFVRFKNLHIFLLVDKVYLLTPATINMMLERKLQADQ
nr:hypothetical protein [Tanacetum cinerariifolium]